jgi:hypothetical protein
MNQLYERIQLHLRSLNSFCDMFAFQTPITPSSPLKHREAAKARFVIIRESLMDRSVLVNK